MNNSWKIAKFGLVLLALPLVATAAASAHLEIVKSSPITVGMETVQDLGTHSAHTVALNLNGGVDGRVASMDKNARGRGVSGLTVRLVKRGSTVARATTNSVGVFSFQSVPTGVYSFIASGDNGFAAYSLRVVPNGSENYDEFMETVAVSREHITKAKTMLAEQAARPNNSITGADADRMDEVKVHRVVLKNGVMTGRLLLPRKTQIQPKDTYVYILQDGSPIASAMINEQGRYEIPGMKPGVYGLVAVGPQGVAVVAFEAFDSGDQTQLSKDSVVFVSTAPQGGQDGGLDVYLIDPQDTVDDQTAPQDFVEQPIVDEFLPIEFAGETFTGGGTAGSFGQVTQSYPVTTTTGGAVGGPGRLLAIAGLTVGVIALADSGDGDSMVMSPSDP